VSYLEKINEYISHLQKAISEIPICKIEEITKLLLDAYREDRQIFIFGNGGSASTASHFACDLGKGTISENCKRFRAISLTDNIALITAWANDTCYDEIFKNQLENLINPGDIVIGISASGNSKNILNAIEYAKLMGCITIGFAGFGGGQLASMVDECIIVNSYRYGPVEDIHLILEHTISFCISEELANESFSTRGWARDEVTSIN